MTIAHFGLCDWTNLKINKYRYPITFTYGMTIIFGIIFFNENQSFEIFEYLTNDKIYSFQKFIFIPYILTSLSIIYFIYLSLFEKKLRTSVLEILLLLLIFYICDPLLSFSIYFCFFHTYKHLKHLIKNIYLELSNKYFVIYTTIFFYNCFLDWWYYDFVFFNSKNFTIYESILKVVFIGLSGINITSHDAC